MADIFFLRFRVNNDVVEVYETKLPVHSGEENVRGSLERCRGVGHAKWHPREAVLALVGDKRCFVAIALVNGDL